MPFQPGHKFGGRRKEKAFYDALLMELRAVEANDQRGLRKIARMLIEKAESGDIQAIREIADRLDGKPVQAVDATVENVSYVVRSPMPEPDSETWAKKNGAELN